MGTLKSVLLSFASLALLGGCAAINPISRLPETLGERTSSYGYVPLDGLAIHQTLDADSCKSLSHATSQDWAPLLESLPDVSVRFSVANFEPNGQLTFGPAQITISGQVYRAVLDYVNVDAIPVTFYIRKHHRDASGQGFVDPLSYVLRPGDTLEGYDALVRDYSNEAAVQNPENNYQPVTIPVYVGIGMRLTADVRALRSNIALSSLSAIGVEAGANALTGTLTVQTLGMTGRSIVASLPLPSKLDETTVENGILALGASRALIYNVNQQDRSVIATPRVVGLYSPIGTNPLLINALYSALSQRPPDWDRPCAARASAPPAARR